MAPNSDESPPRGLVDDALIDELDAPVRTLAETYYEAGFPPHRAIAMAWAVALSPELSKRVTDGGDDW